MQFSITVKHVLGKLLYAADALSLGPGRSSPGKGSELKLNQISLLTLSW